MRLNWTAATATWRFSFSFRAARGKDGPAIAGLSEGIRDPLELPGALGHDVEADVAGHVLGCAASHAAAARRSRRIFSASTISSGSPKPVPDFPFTSQKTSVLPRRTTRSSSYPPIQTFAPRMR